MIAVNANANLVLQGQHRNRLSGDLSMDFACLRPLFLAAIATLAGASAEAGQAPSGLGDLVPGLLPAVVNIYSMKIVAQSDGQTSRVTAAAARCSLAWRARTSIPCTPPSCPHRVRGRLTVGHRSREISDVSYR